LDDVVEDVNDDLDKPDTKDLNHGEDVGEGFVFSGNEGTVPPPKP